MSDATANPARQRAGRLTDLLDADFMARLDALDFVSRRILQGKLQGERRSKRRGQGAEFTDHRPYVVGDDLRFVDWNVFGRLDQLFLKIFLVEEDLTVRIVLDASGSTALGEPPKDRTIRRLAAALAYIGLVNNNRVTLTTFADGVTGELANMRGRNYIGRMADFLLAAPSEGPSRFEKACRQVASARVGTGVLVILSDFLFKEGYEQGLRRLIGRNWDLYALQVLSPQELAPQFEGDVKLVDVEDFDEAEITVSKALLDYYKRTVSAYCNELQAFCRRRGAAYALTDSSKPVEPLLLNYLRRRGMLR